MEEHVYRHVFLADVVFENMFTCVLCNNLLTCVQWVQWVSGLLTLHAMLDGMCDNSSPYNVY